jgi:flagellar biogenesis protein FliO
MPVGGAAHALAVVPAMPAMPAVPAMAVMAGGSGPLDIIAFAVIFVAILLMAYGASKLVGKRAAARMKSRHMEVVDSLSLGQDAHVYLLKAAGELFLVAKSAKSLSMLTKLKPADGAGADGAGAAGAADGAGAAGEPATGAGVAGASAGAAGIASCFSDEAQLKPGFADGLQAKPNGSRPGLFAQACAVPERFCELLARQLSSAKRNEDKPE